MKSAANLWYSQTGHSFRLARVAEDVLKEKGISARTADMKREKGRLPDEDLLVFSFPVFNWNLPWPVREFIGAMPRAQSKKKALLILTMGGWAANTPHIFARALAKKNIELQNFICVRCRDSYIPFAKWLPFMDKQNLPDQGSLDTVRAFMEKSLTNGKKRKAWFNPLDPCHWIGAATPKDGPLMFMGPREFVRDRCTGCGFCAALCPANAIEGKGRDLSWNRKSCIGCCGCINICPENAWLLPRFPEEGYNKGLDIPKMVVNVKRK